MPEKNKPQPQNVKQGVDDLKAAFEQFVNRVQKLAGDSNVPTTISINLNAGSGPGRTINVVEKLTIAAS